MKKNPVSFLRLSVGRNVVEDGVAFMVKAALESPRKNVGVTVRNPLVGGESSAYVNTYVVKALVVP